MTKPRLNESDLCRAAKRAGTSTAEIETFLAVETRGRGFDSKDRPVILFERHWFHKLTRGKYSENHPDISNPRSGGYGKSSQQYARFSEAFKLDPEAAMKATSWGLGQVMGFNHKIVGYDTVGEFVDAMKESEGKQLDAAIEYVIFNGLDDELRRHDWRGFARGYNGPAYEKNDYHNKLAREYAKFSKRKISCSEAPAADAPLLASGAHDQAGTTAPSAGTQAGPGDGPQPTQPPVHTEPKPVEAPPKENSVKNSTALTIAGFTVPPLVAGLVRALQDLVEKGYLNAKEVGDAVIGFMLANTKYVLVLAALVIVLMILKKVFRQATFLLQMWIASDPDRIDVEVKKQ